MGKLTWEVSGRGCSSDRRQVEYVAPQEAQIWSRAINSYRTQQRGRAALGAGPGCRAVGGSRHSASWFP